VGVLDGPDLVTLDPEQLACGWCGVPLPEGAPETDSVSFAVSNNPNVGAWREPFGISATCSSWRTYARALAGRIELQRLGPVQCETIANRIARLACILDVDPPNVSCPTGELTAWINALRSTSIPSWSSYVSAGRLRGAGCRVPWGFLTREDRVHLRSVLAKVLAEKVAATAPPIQIAPPDGGCCAWSGVTSVPVSAVGVLHLGGYEVAAREVWRPFSYEADHGERRTGWLSPQCAEALALVGAVGPTALDTAVVMHLGLDPAPVVSERERLDGVIPWWRSGLPPSPVAWAHLDLDGVRDTLVARGFKGAS
jgi:hypothetical protein